MAYLSNLVKFGVVAGALALLNTPLGYGQSGQSGQSDAMSQHQSSASAPAPGPAYPNNTENGSRANSNGYNATPDTNSPYA